MSNKTRGAVSVFLVMILVPCIVVTSIFVDLGRVHMSKSMAYSSADLAMNALLTNYDADLNEWYGLVASCQSIEEFYDISAQFFLRSLSSQGLSNDEIYLLSDYVSDYYEQTFKDIQISDLLQTESLTAPSDMISEMKEANANLTNASLIKDEVVEFMKYRAPIEITLGIIDRLNKDSSVGDAMDSDENKELVDKKTEFYNAEGKLLAAAFNTYAAIYDYYYEATENDITNDQLRAYAQKLASYRTVYLQIHTYLIKNLLNTDGLTDYTRIQYRLDRYNSIYTKTSSEVYSEVIEGEYYISEEKISDLLDDLEDKIEEFETAISNFENASAYLMTKLPGDGALESYKIQWWVQMNDAVNSSTGTNLTNEIDKTAENMLRAYSKVLAINDCQIDSNVSDDWKTRSDELTDKVDVLRSKYLITSAEVYEFAASGVNALNSSLPYIAAVEKLNDISFNNKNNIKAENLYVTVDGQKKNITEALSYMKSELTSIRSELQQCVNYLNIAIDGNEDDNEIPENKRVKSLSGLMELVKSYNSSLNTWTDTAYNMKDTNLAISDRAEIADLEDRELIDKITEDAVDELKTRLKNIRTQLKSIISAIDALTYGGQHIRNITSLGTLKSAAQTVVSKSDIGLNNQELDNYATSTFSQLFRPETDFALEHTSDKKYNPTIDPETGKIETPELLKYFYIRFEGRPDKTKDNLDEKQKELDDGEDAGATQENAAKDKGRYHGGGTDITKDFSGSGKFNLVGDGLATILDLFDSLVNMDITSIRDDLYVTAYIMEMFSYATYETEGLYSLIEDKTSLGLNPSNFAPIEYDLVRGTPNLSEEYQNKNNGTWLSVDYKDAYNKSLTNNLINTTNNAAYCAEVEYILYGGTNAQNIKDVYGNIYAIRYILNLVSGFANFWSGNNTTANVIDTIAFGIQSATAGIIPMPLTKVIIIPILTIFETAKDMDRLEAGFPVELYKQTDKEWWVKVPDGSSASGVGGLTSIFSSKSLFNGPNTDKGLFYSDYLTVFVYMGLKGSSSAEMYQRMAEVIQANMRKLSGDKEYSMKKSRLYFTFDAQIRVKPLMITLPYFNDYEQNMDTKNDWCTYHIYMVRGYS